MLKPKSLEKEKERNRERKLIPLDQLKIFVYKIFTLIFL